MKNTYKAILFAPDGDYVTDFINSKTKEEVEEKLENMGSRWFFYPIQFVVTNNNTIVATPYRLDFLNKRKLNTVIKWIKANTNELI